MINNYKRRFIKTDAEIKRNIVYNKSAIALRGFLGIGVPLLGIDTNRTLPFFKQYYGGGSNSMRAWPIRGIGPEENHYYLIVQTKVSSMTDQEIYNLK